MKKSDRISALVGEPGADAAHPCYAGFFTCFNAQQYYEAHDVLEHLWLRTEGGDRDFFQGLIQVAGAFVHLQKHFMHPSHPKHATRLRPAARLFDLAIGKLGAYAPAHLQLDVAAVLTLCEQMATEIAQSQYARNPWTPDRAPELHLSHS